MERRIKEQADRQYDYLYYITSEFTVLHWLNVYGWRYVVRLLGKFVINGMCSKTIVRQNPCNGERYRQSQLCNGHSDVEGGIGECKYDSGK